MYDGRGWGNGKGGQKAGGEALKGLCSSSIIHVYLIYE